MAAKKPQGLGKKYIEITIDEVGEVEIEAHGFNGVGCREATKQLEKNLGVVSGRKVKYGNVKQGYQKSQG